MPRRRSQADDDKPNKKPRNATTKAVAEPAAAAAAAAAPEARPAAAAAAAAAAAVGDDDVFAAGAVVAPGAARAVSDDAGPPAAAADADAARQAANLLLTMSDNKRRKLLESVLFEFREEFWYDLSSLAGSSNLRAVIALRDRLVLNAPADNALRTKVRDTYLTWKALVPAKFVLRCRTKIDEKKAVSEGGRAAAAAVAEPQECGTQLSLKTEADAMRVYEGRVFVCDHCHRKSHGFIAPFYHCDKCNAFDVCMRCAPNDVPFVEAAPAVGALAAAAVPASLPAAFAVPAAAGAGAAPVAAAGGIDLETKRATDQVVVLSDVHIGSKWFTQRHSDALQSFMAQLLREARERRLNRLVMLGDIVESWSHKHTLVPVTVDYLLAKPEVITFRNSLKSILDLGIVDVVYVVGNHDNTLKQPQDFQTLLGAGVRVIGHQHSFLQTAGKAVIRLEHGHRYDCFNTWKDVAENDPDSILRYPFGYYITRLDYAHAYTQPSTIGRSVLKFLMYASGWVSLTEFVVRKVLSTMIMSSTVEGSVDEKTTIQLDGQRKVTVGEVIEAWTKAYAARYKGSSREFYDDILVSMGEVHDCVTNKYGKYGPLDVDVVVFGHHHTPCLRDTAFKGRPLLYANSGSWAIDTHDRHTYLRIDGLRSSVSLCEWVGSTAMGAVYREHAWDSRWVPRPPPALTEVDGHYQKMFPENYDLPPIKKYVPVVGK